MPSDFTGYFTRLVDVAKDQIIYSGQANKIARTINERILSGLGDVHWRSLWGAYSLVRNLRNDDGGSPPLEPSENEWFEYYGLLKETNYSWPTAGFGLPEGLSEDCPLAAYFYGQTALPDEKDRKDDCPYREYVGAPVPTTPLETWDLGKVQRGAIDPSDLTDFTYAPAMKVPRVTDAFNSLALGKLDLRHKTAGGKIDTSTDDFIREKGQQWNQLRQQFLNEWRGTDDEREDADDWDPEQLTVDYELMLASQYFLAPSRGVAGSGGVVSAQYPLFEWAANSAADTYGTWAPSNPILLNATGFVFAGFIVVGESLTGDKRVEIEISGEVVETVTVGTSTTEVMIWWPTAKTGSMKIKLLDAISGFEDIWVEVAHLMDHTPEIVDLYLFLRMVTARNFSASIYRGKIVSDAKDISDAYFANGCAVNGNVTETPQETNIALNPQYQAIRDFFVKFFRIANYDRLKGYSVNGSGNSVLTFDRRGAGSADADIFQDFCPRAEEQTQIQKDVLYRVKASGGSPSGEITYDGNDYKEDETFRGTEVQDLDFSGATDLAVYEEQFLIDIDDIPKEGRSNEWVFSIGGQTVYKDTTGATYKPDAYGGVLGAFHDRCHTFSHSMDSVTGSTDGKQFGKYASGTTTGQAIVTRAETPPGHRYDGDEVPYYGVGTFVNPLISTADLTTGAASVDDCYNSIINPSGSVEAGDLDETWCSGISAHFKSCKVYKAPYLIKSIAINSGDDNLVDIELDGRLERNDSAPASIADTSASRATYLSADTGGRSDENTVVGLLRWTQDGVDDVTRIGDISPNAQNPDYTSSDVKGAVLSRFFFQRLCPWVYDDIDTSVEPDEDTKPVALYWQYIEFIVRASIGGFLDEAKILETLEYFETGGGSSGSSSYCTNQDSRDLTMTRVLDLIGSSDDHFCMRYSGQDRGGHGPLPSTVMISDQYNEIAAVLNLMKASRFGVPILLETRFQTYYDYFDADIEYIEGFAIIRNAVYQTPTTEQSDTGWVETGLPYGESATAYMTILNDGSDDKLFCYRNAIQWRARPHPKVLEAVPVSLRSYVDTGGALSTPIVWQPPTKTQCVLDRDPIPADTVVEDFTSLVEVANPDEECAIGDSGTIQPDTPPTGAIAVASTGGGVSSSPGDAESFSNTNIGIETIGEAYIRIPVV